MTASKKTTKEKKNARQAQKMKNSGQTSQKGTPKIKQFAFGNMPAITPEQMKNILDGCYEKAIDGIPNVSKSVHSLAHDYTSKYDNPIEAANSLVSNQLVKCTTSGFLAGLGGLITLPVTIPANISSVMYVQLRMVAAIAEIGGFDPNSDQVQTLAYACLTGQAVETIFKNAGIKIGNKLAVNSISKISGATLTKINQAVGFRLITKFGEKGVINMGKAVPVVGGIIGGGFDLVSTKIIANNACRIFLGANYSDRDLKGRDQKSKKGLSK